jgi:tetratricopeptide (TPR) repeat protein
VSAAEPPPRPCLTPEELARCAAADSVPADVAPHLATCHECRDTLDEIAADEALLGRLRAHGIAPTLEREHAPALPAAGAPEIPGYDVHDEIERGGQGVVYRATQRATSRTVALKVLAAGALTTDRQRRRFEREIELLAGVEHPGVVTVYDSGLAEDGRPYLAMQLVAGTPLDAWAAARRRRPGPAARRDLLRVFTALGGAVAAAHARGVIHRDLKPANVLVDDGDRPHVLDFGLARPLGADAARPLVTDDGAFLGTLAYAAPEQVRGETSRIDVRTDVYALGVILYEMLAGTRPYAEHGGLDAHVRSIVAGAAPPPSRAPGDGVIPIDGDLDAIVMKAMAPERERRYASAAALVEDVERAVAGTVVEARRDRRGYVLRRTLRRHRRAIAAAVAITVVVVAFAVSAIVQERRTRREADKLAQINLFLEDALGSVESAAGAEAVTVREFLDESVEWVDVALGARPEAASAVRLIVGNGYRNLGLHAEADAQLTTALRDLQALHGSAHAEVARATNALGLLRLDEGRLAEAEALVRDALAQRERIFGATSAEVAMSLGTLAGVQRAAGKPWEAGILLERQLAMRRTIFGDVHPDVAMSLFALAASDDDLGDSTLAAARYREALAIRRACLHPRHPDLARTLLALGDLLVRLDRPQEAEPLLRECLDLRRAALPPGHVRIAEAAAALERCRARGAIAEVEGGAPGER